jgi:hypothetical protein
MERAEAMGLSSTVFLGLHVSHDVLGAAVPNRIWRRARLDSAVRSVAAQLTKRLFSPPASDSSLFRSVLFHLRTGEYIRDAIGGSLRLAMTPTESDWDLLRLPAPLAFLYYPLRAVRLATKYGPALARRFLRV